MIKSQLLALNLDDALKILKEFDLDYTITHYIPEKNKFDVVESLRVIKVKEVNKSLELIVSKEQKPTV